MDRDRLPLEDQAKGFINHGMNIPGAFTSTLPVTSPMTGPNSNITK